MDVRSRIENRKIKIGVIDQFSNGKEDAIKPFPMRGHFNKAWENHPTDTIIVKKFYLPGAEIHLVPNTEEGIKYLIEQKCPIVNVSLAGYTASTLYDELANKTFIVCSAGNSADRYGESWLSLQDYSCCVGAVDKDLEPTYYSSYGKGAVKTVSVEPVINGKTYRGTSFSGPVIVGLLGQWYIWYEDIFNCYPSIAETNEFIKLNSHDIFEDGDDLRTGYGIFRLPKKFKAKQVIVQTGNRIANMLHHVEGEKPTEEVVDLLIKPFLHNSRTMVGSRGLMQLRGNVHWDGFRSHYIW